MLAERSVVGAVIAVFHVLAGYEQDLAKRVGALLPGHFAQLLVGLGGKGEVARLGHAAVILALDGSSFYCEDNQ